ncbi:hypothetical protein [Paenibacillus sp. J2TS4]|uniref:hypothetical protein n=1 Tax=Paenibacillus sp. J2TS4 TaxID=2807194 RepID=UPI001AFEE5E8|nr:hypothetical protein [Paenibacillus sp. J2TS4]GIP30987.1 hypothetical protein J2TS4_01970 [Paenibacillus sp. J2TS4]
MKKMYCFICVVLLITALAITGCVTSPEKRTLAPGLIMQYLGEAQQNWGGMMAASITVSVPVTIMFLLLQRFFIQGLTAGAVKG